MKKTTIAEWRRFTPIKKILLLGGYGFLVLAVIMWMLEFLTGMFDMEANRWVVLLFSIFCGAICFFSWKPMWKYLKTKHISMPIITDLLNSREIDAFFQEEVFTPIHELNGRDIRYCDFRESQNWFQLRKYYLSKQLLCSVSLDTYAPPGMMDRQSTELKVLGINGKEVKLDTGIVIRKKELEEILKYMLEEGHIQGNSMDYKTQLQKAFEEEKKKYPDTKTFVKILAKDAQEFKNMVVRKLPLNEKKRYYYEHMGDMKLLKTWKIAASKKNGFIRFYDKVVEFEVHNERIKTIWVKEQGKTRNIPVELYPFLYMTETIPQEYGFLDESGKEIT